MNKVDDVKEIISKINDSPSLALFIQVLEKDFTDNPGEWESLTVKDYLFAISSWVEDEGLDGVLSTEIKNPYQAIALSLYIGKIYE